MLLYKKLTDKLLQKATEEVKMLLHASRDCMRNQGKNTMEFGFSCNDGYYGEAFGIFRGLVLLNYGYFGSVNLDAITEYKGKGYYHPKRKPMRKEQNFKWYFSNLQDEVLNEEGFFTDHVCKHCLDRYGKDDATIIQNIKKQLLGDK
jgi:hypothetical protein